jgi:hypothetical protein
MQSNLIKIRFQKATEGGEGGEEEDDQEEEEKDQEEDDDCLSSAATENAGAETASNAIKVGTRGKAAGLTDTPWYLFVLVELVLLV